MSHAVHCSRTLAVRGANLSPHYFRPGRPSRLAISQDPEHLRPNRDRGQEKPQRSQSKRLFDDRPNHVAPI